jgi:hypothetical protein
LKTIKGHRQFSLCLKSVQRTIAWTLVFVFVFCLLGQSVFPAHTAAQTVSTTPITSSEVLRLERVPIEGGAELVTIHAKLSGLEADKGGPWVPMVTVLRDTLGDETPENDRLRYVWPLTYTRPTFRQRFFAAIPFLYAKVGNKTKVSNEAPPPVLDLAAPDREVWNRIFWTALQSLLLDPYGTPVKASTRSYRQNISDYRKAHVIRALSVLSLYQAVAGSEKKAAFTENELAEIQARLELTDKPFGGLVDTLQLARYSEKSATSTLDQLGHNWELLRQRTEAESLYFEPLQMPDGSTTHALVWVAKEDLARPHPEYSKRFLNIENPWTDNRLKTWRGHVETRYFDADNRPVSPEQAGARAVEMIPLALYGLDHPKIPMLLVDFRDGFNPKKREMSRRALEDVTRNVLSLSRYGDIPYFLGRTVFDFVTGRRGMDINQPSRLRTYSQLKLLLALNDSLNEDLREEVQHRIERVTLNPLENDLEAEAKVARQQYAALMAYAKSARGLPAKLNRDRRTELAGEEHGKFERTVFQVANILSFGKYVHREKDSTEVSARIDVSRRLAYHTLFLRQVAKSSPQIDVVWNMEDVKRSLRFIMDHGPQADSASISALGKIFSRTQDDETRRMCLESLSRIDNPKAKKELIRISQNADLDPAARQTILSYLSNQKRLEPMAASGTNAITESPEPQEK